MTTLHPWINFNGNAEEAFTFYQSIFGGTFEPIVRFSDIASDEISIPEDDAQKIMRIALPIGPHTVLCGNDVPSFMGRVNEQENRSKIVVRVDSTEEADRLFQGLSEGGEIEVGMAASSWGTYFGMFRDRYGIEWIIESPIT